MPYGYDIEICIIDQPVTPKVTVQFKSMKRQSVKKNNLQQSARDIQFMADKELWLPWTNLANHEWSELDFD